LIYNDLFGTNIELLANISTGAIRSPLGPEFWFPMLPHIFISFFATFCWMNARLPIGAYLFPLALSIAAIYGLFRHLKTRKWQDAKVLFAGLLVLFCFAGVLYWNLRYPQSQGRYMFPVLPLIAVLLSLGLKALLDEIRSIKLANSLFIVIIGGLFLFEFASIAWLYNFHY